MCMYAKKTKVWFKNTEDQNLLILSLFYCFSLFFLIVGEIFSLKGMDLF